MPGYENLKEAELLFTRGLSRLRKLRRDAYAAQRMRQERDELSLLRQALGLLLLPVALTGLSLVGFMAFVSTAGWEFWWLPGGLGLLVTFLMGDSFVNASDPWAFLGMTSWWLMFGYLAPVPLAIGREMDIWIYGEKTTMSRLQAYSFWVSSS